MTLRRHVSIAAVGAFVALSLSSTACGILNGIFWDAEVSDDEFCTHLAAIDAKEAECRTGIVGGEGEGAAGEGEGEGGVDNCVDVASCLRDKRTQCPTEWQALLTCVLDDDNRDCRSVTADVGFCDTPLQAYLDCSGIDLDNCNNHGGTCNNNGICDGGESQATCGDCNNQEKCNFNGFCEPPPTANEDEGCSDCCNHDAFCDGNEQQHPQLCGDCGLGCNANGQCDDDETAGTCGDCAPCENNGTCEPFESHVACPDCTADLGCNGNGICDGPEERDTGCVECNGTNCTFNGVCDPDESFFCGDCFRTCAAPSDCPGGPDAKCDSFNSIVCSADPPSINCRPDVPQQSGCWLSCETAGNCSAGLSCAPTAGDFDGFGACEPQGCPTIGQPCGGPNNLCLDVFALDVGDASRGGFCLQNDCDPVACAGTASCSCETTLAPRCAAARNGGGDVADFVCVPLGPTAAGGACNAERECARGTTCVAGTCRQFCGNIGDPCGGGICTALPGSTGVGSCN